MKHESTQREFVFVNWGGKRRGAGRKPEGERALVSHDRRPRLSRHEPVLVTLRLAPRLRSLRADDEHALVVSPYPQTLADGARVSVAASAKD